MGDIDQLARLDRAERERTVDEAVRSVLGLVRQALPGGPEPAITSGSAAVAGLLELPVISMADLLDPADPRCSDGVTLTWPVSGEKVLAVRLLPSLESTVLPDALACLAGAVRVSEAPGEGSLEAAAAQRADVVVGDVMHKLSTPLTSVMAYASLLADPATGPLNADQKQFVETLERNAQRLMEMINESHAGLQQKPTSTGQEDR